MSPLARRALRRLNVATHRDVGYFVSSLVIVYCLSGIALNHLDVFNPDFVITKREVVVPPRAAGGALDEAEVRRLDALVGEEHHRVVDYPTREQVKVYYDNATLHMDLGAGTGRYERISRRPVFYQLNVLHRNSFKPWRWAADALAILLIVVSLTGLLILRGERGLGGRGKWLILAGALPPIVALVLQG